MRSRLRESWPQIADELLGLGGHSTRPIYSAVADRERDYDATAVQLFPRLRDLDRRSRPLGWLEVPVGPGHGGRRDGRLENQRQER